MLHTVLEKASEAEENLMIKGFFYRRRLFVSLRWSSSKSGIRLCFSQSVSGSHGAA